MKDENHMRFEVEIISYSSGKANAGYEEKINNNFT